MRRGSAPAAARVVSAGTRILPLPLPVRGQYELIPYTLRKWWDYSEIIRKFRKLFGNYSEINMYFTDLVSPIFVKIFFSTKSDKSFRAILSVIL